MEESQLKVFVGIVQHFFMQQTGRATEIGTPYLGQPESLPVRDFTGVIGISGARKGCVYFTAPEELLRELLLHVGESDLSQNNLADLAGEIANTISGNARREFGHDFMISVPVVVKGGGEHIQVPRDVRAYVIPIRWHRQESSLVVSVQ